jgi:two-component system phosphate regulon response regulator PhoB
VAYYVLIVDDETDLAQLIEFNLRQAGFDPRVANTGAEAIRLARERTPHLVILDLMLPDMSGVEVCRQLKALPETRAVPVMMLTARGEENDRVKGFEVGADDYVVKPFSVRELILRVKAVLRRSAGAVQSVPAVSLGILRLEPSSHRCFVADAEVHLTLLEFRLLHHLMTRPGRVQTRDQLLEHVWGISTSLETRTVDTHVTRLRDKLGLARDYVETVRGVGYRMVEEPGSLAR